MLTTSMDRAVDWIRKLHKSGATFTIDGDRVVITPKQPDDVIAAIKPMKDKIRQILEADQWMVSSGSETNWKDVDLINTTRDSVQALRDKGYDVDDVLHDLDVAEIYAMGGGRSPYQQEAYKRYQKLVSDGPALEGKQLESVARSVFELPQPTAPSINLSALD